MNIHCNYWKRHFCEIKDFEKATKYVENELFSKHHLSKTTLEASVKESRNTEIIFSNINENRLRRNSSTATLMSFIGMYYIAKIHLYLGNLCKTTKSYKAK